MSRGLSVLQLGRITSTELLLRAPVFSQGSYAKIGRIKFPSVCLSRHVQTVTYEVTNASYVPTTSQTDQQQNKTADRAPKKLENVGAFQKLPMVMPSVDILYSAMRKAKRVSPTKGIANIAKRERNRGAKQLDALMKELAIPLREYLEKFPKRRCLHPYEQSLIELTLGDGNYEQVLRKVDALRKKVVSVGKEHASVCAKSSTKREAGERLSEGVGNLEEIFKCDGKAVDDLVNVAKTLRAMPVVDLEMPTLCLVGAPNVGKSSLVRILSTGKPEVCNYPFTTRGILMGHIAFNFKYFQVTDTPGLLKRSDEDRNNLEKLTLAVLTHLPTAILYVHDLTGECGTSASDQFVIYKEIKERFSDHLWIDVVSKCDLLQESPINSTEDSNDDHFEMMRYCNMGPRGALRVSVKSGEGLKEVMPSIFTFISFPNPSHPSIFLNTPHHTLLLVLLLLSQILFFSFFSSNFIGVDASIAPLIRPPPLIVLSSFYGQNLKHELMKDPRSK